MLPQTAEYKHNMRHIDKYCTLYCTFPETYFIWKKSVDLSRKQPPPISDHFVVPQGWSLTRELTV